MGLRIFFLTALACAVLAGCPSFAINEPPERGVVTSPVSVTVDASPSMSHLVVKLDGTDVSNQITSVSDARSQGNLTVMPGGHTVTAEAEVPCWYCSGRSYNPSHQTNFCVPAQTSLSAASVTALAKADSQTWTKTSNSAVGVGPDDGALVTRWTLITPGGIGSTIGLIESTENSCLCMVSVNDQQNTPIGLAICNYTDATQQWQAIHAQSYGQDYYRFQNNGRGVSSACLTESNNVLIQRGCHDTADQLWKVRDNGSMQFITPFN